MRDLEIDSTASVMQYVYAYQIISRNIPSLQELPLCLGLLPLTRPFSFQHTGVKKFSARIAFIFPVDNVDDEDEEDENENENVGDVVFDYAYLTVETIAAILLHKSLLEKFKVYTSADFIYEEDGVAEVSSHFEESGPILQLVPRCCPLLKTLDFHLHAMSMDDIEMTNRLQAGVPVREEGRLDNTDILIEARVARHLLKFVKLKLVWLGYQT
ncbi:MAG: hypothetical protein J3R72DRAFT_501889 [Linnemannia gamsii]|nr:MAG: hypothetical protein J3R72DRAFT_501889 [Linnemannia gamsii]